MPQIRIRGAEVETIRSISSELIDQLQATIGVAREHFTIELTHPTFVRDGEIVRANPFVEIAWFDRGQEMQDRVAQIVTTAIQKAGYPEVDMVFTIMERSRYYENGRHL